MNRELSPHIQFPEPMLTFHPNGMSDTDIHPLRGIAQARPNLIRLATGSNQTGGHRPTRGGSAVARLRE